MPHPDGASSTQYTTDAGISACACAPCHGHDRLADLGRIGDSVNTLAGTWRGVHENLMNRRVPAQ